MPRNRDGQISTKQKQQPTEETILASSFWRGKHLKLGTLRACTLFFSFCALYGFFLFSHHLESSGKLSQMYFKHMNKCSHSKQMLQDTFRGKKKAEKKAKEASTQIRPRRSTEDSHNYRKAGAGAIFLCAPGSFDQTVCKSYWNYSLNCCTTASNDDMEKTPECNVYYDISQCYAPSFLVIKWELKKAALNHGWPYNMLTQSYPQVLKGSLALVGWWSWSGEPGLGTFPILFPQRGWLRLWEPIISVLWGVEWVIPRTVCNLGITVILLGGYRSERAARWKSS